MTALLLLMTESIFSLLRIFLSNHHLFLFNNIILIMEIFPFMQTCQWYLESWLYYSTWTFYWASSYTFSSFCIIFGKFMLKHSSFGFWKWKNWYSPGPCVCCRDHCGPQPPPASLSCPSRAYLSFADYKERVPSCTLPDDIFPIFIVRLKNRNSSRKKKPLRKK